MASIIPGYEYDIFISYRHKDNKGERWVTEFVNALKTELEGTLKEDISIYFDENPHDGLLETYSVDKSLEGKLKSLIFIPIISQTYCDTKSFAWEHEFLVFNKLASSDTFGRDIKLSNGNVASRILPIKIHDLDAEDKSTIENEIGGVLRSIEFIFKSAGVNRPLRAQEDHPQDNLNKTYYRDQINKVANAIKGIITALRSNKGIPDSRIEIFPAQSSKKVKKVSAIVAGIVLLILLSYWIYPKLISAKEQTILEKSIAVLPFKNVSNDSTQVYFSDGLTIEITDRLTKIGGLRVVPSAPTMEEYKGTEKRISQIAEELGVSYILQGDVRKYENNLRINVRLIAAERNELIWSETLDKPFTEVFQVQGDIAAQVAGFLQITLTENDKGSLAYIPTRFISAYDYFLRAGELSFQRNFENEKAIGFLKEAIKIDSKFVEAWSSLAVRFSKKAIDHGDGRNWLDSAMKTASTALVISPASAKANSSMGFVLMYKNEWDEANFYLKKANQLEPSTGLSLRPLSTVQLSIGRLDSAYLYANKLVQLNIRGFSGGYSQKIRIFRRLGQWDSCQLIVDRALSMDQTSSSRDLSVYECIAFYINSHSNDRALKLVNDNFSSDQGTTRDKEKRDFLKAIYALQDDWGNFSRVLKESEAEWVALMHKRTNNKIEFDRAVAKLKLENPESENLFLMTNNFTPVIKRIGDQPVGVKFSAYHSWLTNPFAKEFIKTPEFKELFAGYEDWRKQMMLNIQRMNE